MKHTEQLHHDDKNLCEAIRRNMTDAPQLPAGFSQRLQQQLQPAVNIRRRWYRMAAAIAALVVMGGLAWAIIPQLNFPREASEQTETQATPQTGLEDTSMIYFSNTPLDSMLSVVGAHYGRAVCFDNASLRQLRFTIRWNCSEPLSTFLDHVNEFEGLQLVDERDTIFVNAEKEVQP